MIGNQTCTIRNSWDTGRLSQMFELKSRGRIRNVIDKIRMRFFNVIPIHFDDAMNTLSQTLMVIPLRPYSDLISL